MKKLTKTPRNVENAGGGGFRRIKKVIPHFLIALLLISTFFAGQFFNLTSSFATALLPVEGTIMEGIVGAYEYAAQVDGNLNATIVSGYGGDGGAGGWGWGPNSSGSGAFGTQGSVNAPNGIGGVGGQGENYKTGGEGGRGGGGTGVVLKIDGQNVLVAKGGDGGRGGDGGIHRGESGWAQGQPGLSGGYGEKKVLTIPIKKGQVVTIQQLNAHASSGGDTPGSGGGEAIKAGWSFTLQTSKKVLTESDSFDFSRRQAEAQEQIVTALNKISGVNGFKLAPDKVIVIVGEQFNEYIKGDDGTTGGSSEGVTVINNDPSDGYVRVSGCFDSSGQKVIVIDGIKYIFKVVAEPNSSNVSVILN